MGELEFLCTGKRSEGSSQQSQVSAVSPQIERVSHSSEDRPGAAKARVSCAGARAARGQLWAVLTTLLPESGRPVLARSAGELLTCEHILVFIKQGLSTGVKEGGGVPGRCEAVPAVPCK